MILQGRRRDQHGSATSHKEGERYEMPSVLETDRRGDKANKQDKEGQ